MADPMERFKTALRKFRSGSQTTSDPVERLADALEDRYVVDREIGSGGMAIVFLAEDRKHHRPVAIKVMRPDYTVALGAARFLTEIAVTANLQHPNILPLYDSGEADGFLYYVMPYVEGESLRQRLLRDRQLSVAETLQVADQVASALESAHRLGVVHRDIKPENVLLREGQAMVADFGIALAVTAAGGERLTATGMPLGTPKYMSPEQAGGEQEIDGRSDIYSLACVVYEMLAGDPPFLASTPRAILMKHLSDPASPITTVRADVPAPLAAAIAKALNKAPADRFESVQAFVKALAAEETAPEIRSIVVLPFENLSPDADNAFFADGLTEDLIAELSGMRQLRVISRTSAMRFKGTGKDVPTIARELKVRYVLEGSVRREGDSVRITAQLIDAATDSHLWAERYSGTLERIFDLQERLSRRIAAALRVALTPDEEQRIATRQFDDFRVYDALLRGRQEMMDPSGPKVEEAMRLVRRAQEIGGEHPVTLACLAQLHSIAFDLGVRHDRQTLKLADAYASRALELAPELGLALAAKAHVVCKEGGLVEAVRLLRYAKQVDKSTDVLTFLAAMLASAGRLDEAREAAAEAVVLDPLDVYPHLMEAWVTHMDGQFDNAVARLQRTIDELELDHGHVLWTQAVSLAQSGRMDEAQEIMTRVAASEEGAFGEMAQLFGVAASGDRAAVLQFLSGRSSVIDVAGTDEVLPIFIADCLAMVGEDDGALEWLGRGIVWGFCNVRYLAEHDRFLAPLREHPRFTQLLETARERQKAFQP